MIFDIIGDLFLLVGVLLPVCGLVTVAALSHARQALQHRGSVRYANAPTTIPLSRASGVFIAELVVLCTTLSPWWVLRGGATFGGVGAVACIAFAVSWFSQLCVRRAPECSVVSSRRCRRVGAIRAYERAALGVLGIHVIGSACRAVLILVYMTASV